MPQKIRVLELFGGIGACSKALERLEIPYEIADYVEIDKYAVASFNAIHGTNFLPQDITKWDKDIPVDLIMHGSPCQDFSVAGKQAGGDEGSGTRSSLMYETLRIVEKLKPHYVIWENVKNLLSKKHRHNFDTYLDAMEKLGYRNFYQVLNAKNYGIPQNRERVFTVSIREREREYEFPQPFPLEKKLKDLLESTVDERYFLSDKTVANLLAANEVHKQRGNGFKFEPRDPQGSATCVSTRVGSRRTDNYISEPSIVDDTYKNRPARQYDEYSPALRSERTGLKVVGRLDIKGNDQIKRVYDTEGVSPTLSTMQGGNRQPKIVASRGRGEANMQHLEARKDDLTNTITSVQKDNYLMIRNNTHKGYLKATVGDGVYTNIGNKRGTVQPQTAQTLATNNDKGVIMPDLRIRKLTPLECWRLMGFDDSDFRKAEKVNSNAQLYKQAGNSIVVNVLEGILGNLLK